MDSRRQTARFMITGGLLLVALQGYDALMQLFRTPESQYTASAEASNTIALLNLSEFEKRLAQPRVKIVFLYASWCPHCRREKPVMAQLQQHYGSQLDIIPIATDTDIDKLSAYLAQSPSPLQSYRINTDVLGGLRLWLQQIGSGYDGGIPHSIIIGSDGKLIDEVTGFLDYDAFKKGLDTVIVKR